MEQTLKRLIKRHGILEVLETIATICLNKGAAFGAAGKRSRRGYIKDAGYSEAAPWHQAARELRRALGMLRREEPDANRVERVRR